MADQILDLMLEDAQRFATAAAADRELHMPFLVARDELGREAMFVLAVEGIHPADQMHVVLSAFRATHAVIMFEAWEVELAGTPEMRAEYERAGTLNLPPEIPRPSQHPERFEALVIIGQARDGPVRCRSWRIDGPPDGPRRLHPHRQDDEQDWQQLPSRFIPLFLPDAEVRVLIRQHAELARLRSDVRERRS